MKTDDSLWQEKRANHAAARSARGEARTIAREAKEAVRLAPLPGLYDPPHDLARKFARRCTDTRARDIWERAVVAAVSGVYVAKGPAEVSRLLEIRPELAEYLVAQLRARGLLLRVGLLDGIAVGLVTAQDRARKAVTA